MPDLLITAALLRSLIDELEPTYGDVAWAEALKPPIDADEFASELIFVICNSGMKNTVARGIFERVMGALRNGRLAGTAFRHEGKADAIDKIWSGRRTLFAGFNIATDKLAYLAALPWIGPVTKYHAAKNFGVDCCKPDVHLARLAAIHGVTPQDLCRRLSAETGYRVATVDTVLWRACATGLINSRTGEVRHG